jgi:hypothetical protein
MLKDILQLSGKSDALADLAIAIGNFKLANRHPDASSRPVKLGFELSLHSA